MKLTEEEWVALNNSTSQTQHNSPKDENKTSFGEISDEEIEKEGNRLCWEKAQEAFKLGAKWYREQLNKL